MEPNEQRKVKLPVDKILRTLNFSGSTGIGMSSTPIQMIVGLLEEWTTSPTPQLEMTYVDPASRTNESLHRKKLIPLMVIDEFWEWWAAQTPQSLLIDPDRRPKRH